MPNSYIQKLSDKYDITIDKLESYWEEAKKTVGDQYDDNESAKYGTIVKVFKAILNKNENLHESAKLNIDDFIFIKKEMCFEKI